MNTTDVIISENLTDDWKQIQVDLHKHTLDEKLGNKLTFCYYAETNDTTVFAGMKNIEGSKYVFVKLVHNEPVNLGLAEWVSQWNRKNDLIPDDV